MSDAKTDGDNAPQTNEEIAVFNIISAATTKWATAHLAKSHGIAVSEVPAKFQSYLKLTLLGNDVAARQIVTASKAVGHAALRARINALDAFISALEEMENALENLSPSELSWFGYIHPSSNLMERVVAGLGPREALSAALSISKKYAASDEESLRSQMERFETVRGRPRNEAAYSVARVLAEIYIEVTERTPTYSEDANGLHGEFTPFLRDIYTALGWPDIALRGPAEAAIASISGEEFDRLSHPFKA